MSGGAKTSKETQESFSLELYASRLPFCQTWPQLQRLLNEAIRVLERQEYEILRAAALKQCGEMNKAAVGPQKGRWS